MFYSRLRTPKEDKNMNSVLLTIILQNICVAARLMIVFGDRLFFHSKILDAKKSLCQINNCIHWLYDISLMVWLCTMRKVILQVTTCHWPLISVMKFVSTRWEYYAELFTVMIAIFGLSAIVWRQQWSLPGYQTSDI